MAKTNQAAQSGRASGAATLLVGALVTGFLFLYYTDPKQSVVWSLGWLPGSGAAPQRSWEEYLVVSITVLLFLPMVAISLIGKEDLADYGVAKGDVRTGWLLTGVAFAAMLLPLYIASGRSEFQQYYPIQPLARTDMRYLVYFQLTYGLYLFCWEFFFRGYLTFGLFRFLGRWGVLLQAVAFTLLHWGKPFPEVVGSFMGAIVLAVIALRCKSFLPAFWIHWLVAATLDLMILFMRK